MGRFQASAPRRNPEVLAATPERTESLREFHDAGAEVASGVYLYRLQAGDFVRSRRMVLVR